METCVLHESKFDIVIPYVECGAKKKKKINKYNQCFTCELKPNNKILSVVAREKTNRKSGDFGAK